MLPENAAPEATDYASRAKALMRKTMRAGALVIMPIGLAVQAHAAVILPANGTCRDGQFQTCIASVAQSAEQNGMEGISGGGGSSFSAFSSGGNGESTFISFDFSGLLGLDANGSDCNGVNQPCQINSLMLSFRSGIEPTSGVSGQPLHSIVSSWDGASVFISLDGVTLFSEFGPGGPFAEGIGGSTIVGVPDELQGKIANLIAGGSGGSVDLHVSYGFQYSTGNSGGSMVDANGTFSIAASDVVVPEPATTGLAMSALLGLGAWLRRRRRA